MDGDRRHENHELTLELREFIVKAEQRHIQTEEWREDMNRKINCMIDKLSSLPCPARGEITKSIEKRLDGVYFWIGGIIVSMMGIVITVIMEMIKVRGVR